MLETAPSLSIYSNSDNKKFDNEIDASKNIEGSCDFSFINKESMNNINEDDDDDNYVFGEFVNDEYCKYLVVDEYPDHPAVFRKYSQLLQGKESLGGAEMYYSGAEADPRDGEILAEYAQLFWEHHHDHDRALTYFDLAAQVAPNNSIVMAAYAKFLWETEDEGEGQSGYPDSIQENSPQKYFNLHPTDEMEGNIDDIESYYKLMIDENPSHPLYLKKYAQFLYQSKGDLQAAEEYYSRAIVVEPEDGEMLAQFGTLLWELYHNQARTLTYLDRAIEASPQNSDVLAAYARILWSINDE